MPELFYAKRAISSSPAWRGTPDLFFAFFGCSEIELQVLGTGTSRIDYARDKAMGAESPGIFGRRDCNRPFPSKDVGEHKVTGLDFEQALGTHLRTGQWRLVKGALAEGSDTPFQQVSGIL